MKLVPELDGSINAGFDCGPAAAAQAVRWATGNAVQPTASQVRGRMGVPDKTATTSGDQEHAFDSYAADARKAGLKLTKADRIVGGPWSSLVDAVAGGLGAMVQVTYAVVNEQRPDLSGDKNWMKGHSVFVAFDRVVNGQRIYKVWDPLCDGRAHGIPTGPQWWPEKLLHDAAGAFAGPGRATYTAVRVAQHIVPPPPPDPVQQLKDRIDVLTEALGVARTALQAVNPDAIAAALADISDALPTTASDASASGGANG